MLQHMNTETLVKPANEIINTTKSVDFGNGRYSPLMIESYKDSQAIFGLTEKAAEKLARQIGSDFGAAMRGTIATAKIGKALSKDGKITLAEAAKAKGVTATNALMALRAMDYANGAIKFGFNRNETKWQSVKELADYLASLD